MKFQNLGDEAYNKLISSDLGQAMLKAQEKTDQINMSKYTNEIGKEIFIPWNPYNLNSKYKFSIVVADAFDEMIKEVIPKDTIISSQFQSWINKEKNELMVDSKLNRDQYFKEQIDFETGEVYQNSGFSLVNAKMNYLEKSIEKLKKAFTTFLNNNPEKALANNEECKAWKAYYEARNQEVSNYIQNNDFSYYNTTDKEGKILEEGTQEKALEHQNHIQNKINAVDKAQAEAESRMQEKAENQNELFSSDEVKDLRKQKQ
ncbi:hypothetical protein ACSL7O_001630 [Campylobacter jejuni]